MGIPKFAYFLTSRYPLIVKKIKVEADVPEIDNLYLDFNGIIHNVSHNYFCDASKITSTTNEIYAEICEVINQIVHLVKPKKLLMISVDGVAPRAKMNQQRIRRFRKDLNAKREEEKKEKENKEENNINEINNNNDIVFDTNAISPGTKFMFHLTYYIKDYILKQKKVDANWMNIEVLLSGSDVPGEGEHKILEYIRNYKLSESYNPYTKHCIYGLDADLIMLSLISHEYNFIILREDFFKMRKKEKEREEKNIKEKYIDKKIEYEFFLISVLREYLELEFGYLKKKIKFKYDFEKIIDDFIFLCFFIGNDFLPNLFSFNIEKGALTHLFEFYKACLPELDGYLTDKGKINFKRVLILFDYLSKYELHSIDLMIRKEKNENKKERMKRTKESKEQIMSLIKIKKEEKKKKFIEDVKNKNKDEQQKIKKELINKRILKIKKKYKIEDNFENEYMKYKEKNIGNNIENQENKLEENLEKFFSKINKYDKYISDKNYCSDFKEGDINDSDISDVDINEAIQEVAKNIEAEENFIEDETEDPNDINILFMKEITKFKTAKEVKEFYYKEKLNIDLKEEKGKKERDKIFNKYMEGLQWILYYYYNTIKSWKWFYPYHYAPMISDFSEINIDNSLFKIFNTFDKDKSEPFNPYQSLLFILPKQSFNLLPECYKDIPIKLKEYFPDEIVIDYNGKTAEYESLLLLPVLDENIMLEMENKFRKLTQEEENENKWGTSYLFPPNNSGNDNIIFNEYEIYQKNPNNKGNKEYKLTKCDFSFPTLKTIDYDYQLINIKQYFGRTSNITKQINICPKITGIINKTNIYWFLYYRTIFIDYPFKAFGELRGFIYSRVYYYLYGDYLYTDKRYRLTDEIIESIRYSYQKKGIILQHPEILCDVAKLEKIENYNGEIKRIYDDNYSNYIPFEITSLNATNKDFQMFIKKVNSKIGGNYEIFKNKNLGLFRGVK